MQFIFQYFYVVCAIGCGAPIVNDNVNALVRDAQDLSNILGRDWDSNISLHTYAVVANVVIGDYPR